MTTHEAATIIARLTRIIELISYAEHTKHGVDYQNARLAVESLKHEIASMAEPHADILTPARRYARIVEPHS